MASVDPEVSSHHVRNLLVSRSPEVIMCISHVLASLALLTCQGRTALARERCCRDVGCTLASPREDMSNYYFSVSCCPHPHPHFLIQLSQRCSHVVKSPARQQCPSASWHSVLYIGCHCTYGSCLGEEAGQIPIRCCRLHSDLGLALVGFSLRTPTFP